MYFLICNSHSRIKKGENLLTVSHGHRANKLLEGDSGMVSEQQDNEGRSLISSAGAGINDEQNSNYHMNEISKILCGFAQNLLSSFVEAFDAKAMEGLKRSSSFNKTNHFVMEGVKFICSTNKSFENENVNFLTDFLVKNIHKKWILSSGDILTTRNLSLKTCKNEQTKSLLFCGGRHQLLTIKMQELQEHIHSLIGGKKEMFYQSNGVLKRNFIKPDENFDSNRQKRQAIPRESLLNVFLVIYLTAFYILVHVINWFLDHEPNLPAGYKRDVFIFYLCLMASLINGDPYLRRHAKNVLAHLVTFVVNEPAQEFRHVAPPLYNQQQMPIHARELASAQRLHQTQRSNEGLSLYFKQSISLT